MMNVKNVLVVHKLGYAAKERLVVRAVCEMLTKNNISFRAVSPLEVHHGIVQNRDCIIIVGGDGTFLKTAHHVTSTTPFLCVTADEKNTEGFFSNTTIKDLKQKMNLIISGKCKKKILWRLVAKINGKAIEPCLNEYYIGRKKPYDVANYILQYKNKKELQKSSGVLVSTPAGSTAWSNGAGGKILPIESKQFQFVVREPYKGRITKTTMHKHVLKKTDDIIITSQSNDMIIVADALGREHRLENGTYVEISLFSKPISLIW